MKKLLLLLVASLSLTVSAQTYTHNSKVRVKTTNTAASTDNIVSIDANGELKRTTQTVSDIGGTPTTPNIQQVLGAGNYSTLGIDFSNAGMSLSNGNYYSELYASAFTMNESVSGASFNNASTLSPLSFDISKDNGVGVSVSTVMQATGVIMLEGGSPTTELTKDELRQYSGYFYGATKVTPSLTSNRTYTMPDNTGTVLLDVDLENWSKVTGTSAGEDLLVTLGDSNNLGLGTKIVIDDENELVKITSLSGVSINGNILGFRKGGVNAVINTIDEATAQTSATLNVSHPFTDNPEGTIVINKNSAQKYMYTRVSSTLWRRSELMTGI